MNSQDYAQKPQRNCTFMNSAAEKIFMVDALSSRRILKEFQELFCFLKTNQNPPPLTVCGIQNLVLWAPVMIFLFYKQGPHWKDGKVFRPERFLRYVGSNFTDTDLSYFLIVSIVRYSMLIMWSVLTGEWRRRNTWFPSRLEGGSVWEKRWPGLSSSYSLQVYNDRIWNLFKEPRNRFPQPGGPV